MAVFILLLITIILSGLEPFVPWGSLVVALAAVLGVKRQTGDGLIAAILAGIIRDVLLVAGLGITSSVLAGVWALGAIGMIRINRPQVVVMPVAALGAIILAFISGRDRTSEALASAVMALGLFWGWSLLTTGGSKIQLRQ